MDEDVIKRIKGGDTEFIGGTESVFVCMMVYMSVSNNRKQLGVDLKFVFCIMGKLDINKRHGHTGGDPLWGVLESVSESPRKKKWSGIQY